MGKRDFTSAKAKEALLKNKDNFCGACCWFCHEDTDGWGQCLRQELCDSMNCSDLCTTDEYVSRAEMRHHMAVLLKEKRWQKRTCGWCSGEIFFPPEMEDVIKAMEFAYRYMKVFSKL